MLMTIIVLSILVLIFAAIAAFLGNEHLKKFKINYDFFISQPSLCTHLRWYYHGSAKHGHEPGMRTVVLRYKKDVPKENRRAFQAKIGFQFDSDRIDFYGYAYSKDNIELVFSTYLGKGVCSFVFETNLLLADELLEVSSTEEDQQLTPSATYPPHWWQRLGFFG